MYGSAIFSRSILRAFFWFAFALPCLLRAQSYDWVWLNGNSVSFQNSVFGNTGVPSAQNTPGARFGTSRWTDKDGNYWVFGGESGSTTPGGGYLLDELWKYDRGLRQWIFVKGDFSSISTRPVSGVYGTKGVPDAANHPGARGAAASWLDANGDFWIFGGQGYDSKGNYGKLADLWKFSSASAQWTWISGNDVVPFVGAVAVYGIKGVADPANLPGGRMAAASWTDRAGNLWLFGGWGIATSTSVSPDHLNDLWQFDIASGQWTWVSGSDQLKQNGSYGTLGVASASNSPGGRDGCQGWLDQNGNFLLFAGMGMDSIGTDSYMNDLWSFNTATNQWTWIAGSNRGPGQAVYGTQGIPSSANIPSGRTHVSMASDANGNQYFFGGYGIDSLGRAGYLDDLWKYDATSGEWTWLGPSTTIPSLYSFGSLGNYGFLGVATSTNQPGSRFGADLWADEHGTIWMFGGFGLDSGKGLYTDPAPLNDLWAFNPTAAMPVISPNGGAFDGYANVSIDDPTPSAKVYFTLDGSTPTTSSTLYSGPLKLAATGMLNAIATADGYMPSDQASASFTVNPNDIALTGTKVSISAGAATGNVAQITVTPVNGFTGTVTLTAALTSTPVAATKLPTLSFGSTGTVAINSATAQTASLTITTVAPTVAAMHAPFLRWLPTTGTAFCCVLLIGFRKRARKFAGRVGAVALMVVVMYAVSGCGGGGGSNSGGGNGGGGGQTTPGTTPGSYTITVTGTSGTLVRTTTVDLTVQ